MELSTEDLFYIKGIVAWESPEGDVDYLILNDDRVLRIDAKTIRLCAGLSEAVQGQSLLDRPVIQR